jgi:UDP-N-acetylmuramoyl-L-alanyl-D-glutamate--2,6-diaminopimelate ligase
MPADRRVQLAELLARTPDVNVRELVGGAGGTDVEIRAISIDTREVVDGALFCCSPGERSDGHDFATEAVNRGAVALVVDHYVATEQRVPQIVVGSTRVAIGHLAATFYDHPSSSLRVVGITGTNGKTTSAHIMQCALHALGVPTGVIGTLSGKHTTPEAPELQRRLAQFVEAGDRAAAIEVSSHALALDRTVGTHCEVGIFTNLGRDHLDLHGTQERYFAAKAKLFTPSLSSQAVVNGDDVYGQLLIDAASIPTTSFGIADARDVTIGPFDHAYTWRGQRIRVGLGGHFNVLNSLGVATALQVMGFQTADIAASLAQTTPVPGRFEPVVAGQSFAVIVDFAHTPDALDQVLQSARKVAEGRRVIVVFGCGGDRDRSKRPEMGAVAARLADLCLVTSDNPRSEDPLAIINDTIEGVPASYRDRVMMEPDRGAAIEQALRLAQSGDVVVIAGKGHETTQTILSTTVPFDDRVVARNLLESML